MPADHQQSQNDGSCTVIHPQYPFLAFDDPLTPTKMTIFLTPQRLASDLEDKRRKRLAQEVEWALAEQGRSLQVTSTREQDTLSVIEDNFPTEQRPSERKTP